MLTNTAKNTIVLLGVGHTNAHIVKMWKMHPIPDAQLICVSNFPVATYSGMLPGVLSGQYQSEEMEIDLVRLCASAGVRLIIGDVTSVDTTQQKIKFRDRPDLAWDFLSIGIGSRPSMEGVEVSGESLVAAKPMQTLLQRLAQRIETVAKEKKSRHPSGLSNQTRHWTIGRRVRFTGIYEEPGRRTLERQGNLDIVRTSRYQSHGD